MRGQRQGFTLIELLVSMALIGIIFALVTNWQASTLSISTRTNAMSQRLSDLNDVTGYVGDQVRSALAVRVNDFTINSTSANAGKCDAVTPCLAVLVPQEDFNSSTSKYDVKCLYLIYRLEPRYLSSPYISDRIPDSWADLENSNVAVLNQYKLDATPSSGNCFDQIATFNNAPSFTNMGPNLVSDYFNKISPFSYDSVGRKVTLSFQTKQQVRGQTQLTPATPYTLTVQARNVP